MEAFFVVVVAVTVLGVGVLALLGLRRMNSQMRPNDPQET
jgi:Tfp pilus assembly protein PilV